MSRSIVITGASRGLGFCLASECLERGDRVYGLVRSRPEQLERLQERFPQTLNLISCDVGDTVSVEAAGKELAGMLGHIDVLINNAGVNLDVTNVTTFEHTDFDEAQKTFNINTIGPMRVVKALYPLMGKDTLAVAISSSAGSIACNDGIEVEYAYRMSKTALNMGMKLFSNTAKQKGVRTVLIDPGWMHTDMCGPAAPCDPADNARLILGVLDRIGEYPENELFLSYQGNPVPW